MLPPFATVAGVAGVHTTLLSVPALALGTQLAPTAEPGPLLVQVSVPPLTTSPGSSTAGRPLNTGTMSALDGLTVCVVVQGAPAGQLGVGSPPLLVTTTELPTLPVASLLTTTV